MAHFPCKQLCQHRRRILVLIFCILAGCITLNLTGYNITRFKHRNFTAHIFRHANMVAQNLSNFEYVAIQRQGKLNTYVSTSMAKKSLQENLLLKAVNSTSISSINFQENITNQIVDHTIRRLELKKMLQKVEAWKTQHAEVLDNRNVPLKLAPPPHVNDSYIWNQMLQIFPSVFRRLMKPFLADYKNPCFRQADGGLRCLPYFIEIGAAKCGSTDLYYHITRHPQVVRLYKEPHFWTHVDKSDNTITKYLNTLGKFSRALVTERDKEKLIFGDGSPSYFWENNNLPRKDKELIFLWADVIHAVMPGAKIILILRNPTDRTISDYFYSGMHQSSQDFHRHVQRATMRFNTCLKQRSYRACATRSYYPRIQVSLYIAHVREWLRLYPREQFLVLRTEDWHHHANNDILQQIFKFLELDELAEADLPKIEENSVLAEMESKKATEKKSKQLGYVLPETRAYLDKFFEPYNRELAEYLGDNAFLWND